MEHRVKQSREIWKIVIIYALFGCSWIIFSDKILQLTFDQIDLITELSILKGLAFIFLTSALLFILITRLNKKINQSVNTLKESEKRFHFMIENSSDCIVLIDASGRQQYVSMGAERIFGFTHSELEGKTLEEIIHPEDLPLIEKEWQILTEGTITTGKTIEYRHIHKNGGWVTVEAVASSFLHEPSINGVIASVRDITARKDSEKTLQERNHFIDTILDNLPIGLSVNHVTGGTALYMNRKFEEIYGWPKEDLSSIDDFFQKVYPDPAYRKKIKQQVADDIRSGDPARMVWEGIEVTGKNGTKKTILAKNIPVHEQDLMISTVQDITESISLQRQLTQAQKMESVGRLAGGVAHDYNNMLGIIIGYADIAKSRIDPGSPVCSYLQEIHKAAKKSAKITQQLLAFARKQTIEPRLLNLNDAVANMLKMLNRLIGEDIELIWRPQQDLWLTVIDPTQVDQILANLCVNSRDAIADTGEIVIETANVELDGKYCREHAGFVPGKYIMLAISDNGCGMQKTTLEHAFEPFYTTKETGKGTGLGLATVYGIVKQNSGFIQVDSVPDEGTTAKIFFPPQAVGKAKRPGQQKGLSDRGNGENILLVEDEESILNLACEMLEELNYTVMKAPTPGEAIFLAEKYGDKIQLLITDVILPKMNGRDLAERLRELNPSLRVLFMSGYTADLIARHGVLNSDVHFLQKPFSQKELMNSVADALSSKNE